jgi:hydrogenase maturation protease
LGEKKLVIGLGNILLRDDGVGVRCIELMRERGLGGSIKLLDGGTPGFGLLEDMRGFEKVVIVDAVDMEKEPGHIASFGAEELLNLTCGRKFSLHETSLADVVQVGKKVGYDFGKVRIVGIQPKDVSPGQNLSEVIEQKLPALVERVLKEIDNQKGE